MSTKSSLSLISLIVAGAILFSFGFAAESEITINQTISVPMQPPAFSPVSGGDILPAGSHDSTRSNKYNIGFYSAPEDSFIGHKVGYTWYDLQHNGTMGRQIATGTDGLVHFSWAFQGDGAPGSGMRLVHFNSAVFSDGTWENLYGSNGRAISYLRAGFANTDVFNNRAVVSWHEGPAADMFTAVVALEGAPGIGYFGTGMPPGLNCTGSTTNGHDSAWVFPKVHADQDTGMITDPIIHLVNCEVIQPGELLRSMIYHRSHGPGFTNWIPCSMFVDSVATISPLVRQDPNSDRVALIWLKPIDANEDSGNQYNNDVVYCISTDRGLSWGTEINVTQYQMEDLERAYSNLSAMFSSDGCLHIVWDAPVYNAAEGTVSIMANKLRHWDDCNDCISLIVDADNYQSCLPGRWNYNVSKQNISECDGKLYVTYTYFAGDSASGTEDCSVNGYANGEIYVQGSVTGGLTWSSPLNLTNTPDDGCTAGGCESEHWSSCSMYSSDSLYLFYVGDADAGGWAGGIDPEGEATECPMMFFTHPCFAVDGTAELHAEPGFVGYPFNVQPGAQRDTVVNLLNVGNASASFVPHINYITGSGWLQVTPSVGQIGVACENSENLEISCNGPLSEGLYRAEVLVQYDQFQVKIPLELYCFDTLHLPQNAYLYTEQTGLSVRQTSRIAAGESGGGFHWFNEGDDFLLDGSLILGTNHDNLCYNIFHSLEDTSDADNPWKRLYALSATSLDTASSPAYRYAAGYGSNADSSIAFASEFYAPRHSDSDGFYIAHFDIFPGPHFTNQVSNLIIAYAVDWEIPSDSGSDNLGGVDSELQLVYQQGQYPGSPESNDLKFGGVAFRADDSALAAASGGLVWENDRYVYPESGYHVDSLIAYLSGIDGWVSSHPDSSEDLNSIVVIDNDAVLTSEDTISFSLIIAASNDNDTSRSSVALQHTVAMADSFICAYVTADAPHCPQDDCLCGDADGSAVWNISDAVFLIAYIFGGGPSPDPECLGDADGSGVVNISDAVYLISYIFGGGPEPHC